MSPENGERPPVSSEEVIVTRDSPEAIRAGYVVRKFENGELDLDEAKALGRELGLNL